MLDGIEKRYASIWMPHWRIECHQRRTRLSLDGPFALVTSAQGGVRVTAANMAAQGIGVRPGQLLADARTLYPSLVVDEAAPGEDEAMLLSLSQWFIRYTPWVAVDAPDG